MGLNPLNPLQTFLFILKIIYFLFAFYFLVLYDHIRRRVKIMRPKNELYRNKYIIGIYEGNDDTLVTVLDNASEFAEFFKLSKTAATQKLYYLFKHYINCVYYLDKKYYVHFITE